MENFERDLLHSSEVDKKNDVTRRLGELYGGYLKNPEIAEYFNKAIIHDSHVNHLLETRKRDSLPIDLLEIGSGTGLVGKTVQEFLAKNQNQVNLIFSDRNKEGWQGKTSNAEEGYKVIVDNKNLPFQDGAFDMIVARSVHHYEKDHEDEKKVLEEVRRVLKPGGFFLDQAVSFPFEAEVQLWREINELIGRAANMRTTQELMNLLYDVWGQENVTCSQEQPPKIHQDEPSFLSRYKVDESAQKEEMLTQIRSMILKIPEDARPDIKVSKDGFSWDVTFTLLICEKPSV